MYRGGYNTERAGSSKVLSVDEVEFGSNCVLLISSQEPFKDIIFANCHKYHIENIIEINLLDNAAFFEDIPDKYLPHMIECWYKMKTGRDIEDDSSAEILPVSSELCVGCTACVSVCPKNAIIMQEDDEGFIAPTLDRHSCIHCGRCHKICPILDPPKHDAPTVSYATWIKDDEHRNYSSSGGLAYAISKSFIEGGGVVCGAVTNHFKVEHLLIDSVEELIRIQGSKYVQSDLGDSFIKINELLRSGRKVLFIGTPCQVAGIKNFIKSNADNLYTIDLICHGVPSPGVLRRYINELRQTHYTANTMTFRDKTQGWKNPYAFSLYDENGEQIFREIGADNPYLKGFFKNVFLRKGCYKCQFACQERVGDITLGDYWNIGKFDSTLEDGKGTSIVLISTDKGRQMLEMLRPALYTLREVPMSFAVGSLSKLREPVKISPLRNRFFQHYKGLGRITDFLERELWPVGVLGFFFSNNFGAVLVAYSVCEAIKKLGYKPEIINYRGSIFPLAPNLEKFRQKHFNLSNSPMMQVNELQEASHRWKRIVAGSDQIWRLRDTGTYMCNWASGDKTLISYAASFGQDTFSGNISHDEALMLLKRFDFISVREKSGVDICNKEFRLPAMHVLDSTMLLNAMDYEKLMLEDNVTSPTDPYVCAAFVNIPNLESVKRISVCIGDKYPVYSALFNDKPQRRPITEWMSYIHNAKFVITDSFHAVVFSIIFHKQFVAVINTNGKGRIPSLLKQFNLPSSRIYSSIEEISLNSFEELIDYSEVDSLLNKERIKAFDFLRIALSKSPTYKEPVDVDTLIGKVNTFPHMHRLKTLVDTLKRYEHIYVYGAGFFSKIAIPWLKNAGIKVEYVLVSSKMNNPTKIEDVPVMDIATYKTSARDYKTAVFIATSENYHSEICQTLREIGLTNVFCTRDIDLELMSNLLNRMRYMDTIKTPTELVDILKHYKKIYLYGAGNMCRYMLPILKRAGLPVECILVALMLNNPSEVDGIPVMEIHSESIPNDKSDIAVVVSVSSGQQFFIYFNLLSVGFKNIFCLKK